MSEYDWDDDDLDGAPGDGNAMKELRKAYNAEKKRNKEMVEKLSALESSVRERSVKDIVASKGLPEKIARLIPADVTSPEDVENWVAEYADLFGVPAPQDSQEPAANNADLQALERISSAQSSGQTYNGDATQLDALIRAAQTPEELNNILFGSVNGPQVV